MVSRWEHKDENMGSMECGSETLLLAIRYQEVTGTAKTPIRRVGITQTRVTRA